MAELTAARVQASERFLSLKAEQGSLELETKATKAALDEVSAAYDDLQRTYEKGVLHAPVSGRAKRKPATAKKPKADAGAELFKDAE